MATTPADPLLERVRKLLAQAEDPAVTEAEAEAFNAKAAELIAKYGIEQAVLAHAGAARDEIDQREVLLRNPYRRDKGQLLACVADPLRCRTVHYPAQRGTTSGRAVVFGHRSDLERVEILFTSLLLQATRQLVQARPGWSHGGQSIAAYRRSWLAGFTAAVHRRLTAAEQQAAEVGPGGPGAGGPGTALVLADRSARVERAFAEAFPGLRSARRRELSGSGLGAGYRAGSRADLGATRLAGLRRALRR
jgi:hypothetical protein